jgi:predicted RNA-binding protein
MPKFHLLITPQHFKKCAEYGLFGVGRDQINQLANVHAGDLAFIYTTQKIGSRTRPVIHGPFRVISELFFNDQLVWVPDKRRAGRDKFPYRVKLAHAKEHVCIEPIPVQRLWDLRAEGKVRTVVDASALTNKSVVNLLPDEGMLLLEALVQANPRSAALPSEYAGHGLGEHELEPVEFAGSATKEFRQEVRLETWLLQHPEQIWRLAGFEPSGDVDLQVYNQVSTYVAGGNVDLVAVYRKRLFESWLTLLAGAFELKKGVLDPGVLDQVVEYMEWVGRLLPGLRSEMVTGVAVGRAFGAHPIRESVANRLGELRGVRHLRVFCYHIDDTTPRFEEFDPP